MADASSKVLFRTEYFDLVHDINATLVMSQIHYWYMPNDKGVSKLQVFKYGKWWLAKSAEDWWQEARLTKRQVERAIAILVDAGLIRIEVFKFRGAPTRHIICDVLGGVPLSKRLSFSPVGAFQSTSGCNENPLQVQSLTETTSENTAVDLAADAALPSSLNNGVGKTKPHLLLEGTEMATAAETLAKFQSKTSAAHTGKVTPSAIGMRWKKLIGAEGAYVKELTGMQLGQLKQLHKALGDDAMAVMEFAVLNWSAFCWDAKATKGLGSTPEKPDIGFLQKYHDVAVQLIAKKSAKPTVQAEAPVQSVSVPEPVAVKPAPVEDKPSEEDVTAIFAALEALHPSS